MFGFQANTISNPAYLVSALQSINDVNTDYRTRTNEGNRGKSEVKGIYLDNS
jgi:hypothetical protein